MSEMIVENKRLVKISVITEGRYGTGRRYWSVGQAMIDPQCIESVIPGEMRDCEGVYTNTSMIAMTSGDKILAAMTIHEIAKAIIVGEIDK